ncbi:acyl-CoA carboxylase epsilon subunit [Streptomyces synnematoformans]|uniref:Acyl-CoA carboxylase subunit epsilon n=1 Tax=Streptomyces synnematoformans TaxID=415721 RepID=A0ABP4KMV9_9ACTN
MTDAALIHVSGEPTPEEVAAVVLALAAAARTAGSGAGPAVDDRHRGRWSRRAELMTGQPTLRGVGAWRDSAW